MEDNSYETFIKEQHKIMQKTVDQTVELLIKNQADLIFKEYFLSLLEASINDYMNIIK